MDDHHPLRPLIERIVAGARIPRRADREDLRRELWTHFEEAGASPSAIEDTLRRFGGEPLVTESLRRVYRFDYAVLYLAKIAFSVVASVAAALVIQVLVNLRVELQAEALRLAPGFARAAPNSAAVILGLVTAWEIGRPPFLLSRALAAIGACLTVCVGVQLLFAIGIGPFVTAATLVVVGYLCSARDAQPRRLLLTAAAFAAVLYADHLILRVSFAPARALAAGAVLAVLWSSTVFILTRIDRAFERRFEPARDTAR